MTVIAASFTVIKNIHNIFSPIFEGETDDSFLA